MKASPNRMISHTSIYMLGDILRHSTSLIMLPIYTRFLTPEDYGTVELLSMLIDFTAIIFGARVAQAVFRYYCTATEEHDKKSVIASALLLGVIFDGVGAIIVSLLATPIAIAVFSDPDFSIYIILYAITLALLPLTEIPLTHIRAQQKPWLFTIFSITKLALQVSLNIYFVVYREMHVEGVIYSAVISSAVMAILLSCYSLPKVGRSATMATCKKLFSFSIPLKLATLGSFYLTFGDRYILNIYTDLSQVGIYSLGYKFGFIFTLLAWTPFEKIWDSEKYNIYKKPNAKQTYQKTFLYSSSILIFLGLCISLFTKDLLTIMSDPAFLDAYKIVPIIILAYIFQAWTKFCDLGILLKKKTMQIAHAEMIAAVVITIAYFTLIPAYGIYGAAWATLIGFATRFYWTNRKGKESYDMELPWGKIGLASITALFIFALSLMVPDDILTSITLRTALVFLYAVIFLALPILTKQDKKNAFNKIIEFKNSIIHRNN